MAVNINNFTAGTNVAKFDFAAEGVVDNNELKALLESQKDKYSVVSVENGKLVLYVNPRRRDNFLVAFFKKYFVGDANDREIYRQEERLLDNADKLAKNASFQQKIRLVENLRQKEGEIHSYESTQALAQLDKTLNTYLAEKQGTVKVNNLNELARGTNDVVQELAEACKACQLCNHYDNTVLISDKANCLVNIFEFITQHINIREYDPQGRIFKEDGQVDEEFLMQKIIEHCQKNPDDFGILGCSDEARTIRETLTGKDTKNADLKECVARIANRFKTAIAHFAIKAYKDRRKYDDTAKVMYDMLKKFTDPSESPAPAKLLTRLFSPEAIADQVKGLPQDESMHVTDFYQSILLRVDNYKKDHGITDEDVSDFQTTNLVFSDLSSAVKEQARWTRMNDEINKRRNVREFIGKINELKNIIPAQAGSDNVAWRNAAIMLAMVDSDRLGSDAMVFRNGFFTLVKTIQNSVDKVDEMLSAAQSDARKNYLGSLKKNLELYRDAMRVGLEFMLAFSEDKSFADRRQPVNDSYITDFFTSLDDEVRTEAEKL